MVRGRWYVERRKIHAPRTTHHLLAMHQPNKKKSYIKQVIWRTLVIFVAVAMILSMVLPFVALGQ